MIVKYCADWDFKRIDTYQCEKETAKFIWVVGGEDRWLRGRTAKETNRHAFFDTWEEAHSWLLDRALDDENTGRRYLQLAKSVTGNIRGLKTVREKMETTDN